VKAFITNHGPRYDNFEVRYIGGADPELVFVKEDDSEDRIPVDALETKQICELLEGNGFVKLPPRPGEEVEEEEEDEDEDEANEFHNVDDDEPGMEKDDSDGPFSNQPRAPAPEPKIEL